MKRETAEWVSKAEGDWRVANREMSGDDPVFDAVCFHAQQCAEKYLKAWLVENQIAAQKTHDLVFLSGLMEKSMADIREMKQLLGHLTTCAVAFRYPGEEAVIEDARASLETAAKVREIIKLHLNPDSGVNHRI